jgi:hypothetical protein
VPHLDELKLRILEALANAFASGQHTFADSDLRQLFQQHGVEPRFDSITCHFVSLGILQGVGDGMWRVHQSAKKLWDFLPRAVGKRPTPGADELPCRLRDGTTRIVHPTSPNSRIWEPWRPLCEHSGVFQFDRVLLCEGRWFSYIGDELSLRSGNGPVPVVASEITPQDAYDWFIGYQLRLPKPERWKMDLPEELRDQSRAVALNGIKRARRRGRKPDPGIDPKKDRRLCADWIEAKGQGTTREAFARKRGITVQNLIDAQHREKYRKKRDAE